MFSRKLFFTVEAVLYIAYNSHAEPISSKEIAERQGLPPRYLEQLLQKLVREGILRGVRGPKGGYLLARERRRITIGDICQAVKEEDEGGDSVTSTPLGRMIVEPVWQSVNQLALEKLNHINMAELCEQAIAQRIRKRSDERMDFAI